MREGAPHRRARPACHIAAPADGARASAHGRAGGRAGAAMADGEMELGFDPTMKKKKKSKKVRAVARAAGEA